MTDLGQGLDGGIAGLAGKAVLARHDQDAASCPGLDELMRQHRHSEARGPAKLDRVCIPRPKTEVLREHRREHEMRQRGRVARDEAVNLAALQLGIRQGLSCRLAH